MRRPLLFGSAALAAAWAAPALAPLVPQVASALGIGRRTHAQDGVAITFDDGPHPQGTPAVLEALRDSGDTATFFLVGEQVERYPALAAEIVSAGHQVAVHGHRHRNLLRLSPRQVTSDLERALASIGAATGVTCDTYRPPYGIFSLPGIAITGKQGLRPMLWSRWGHDWRARATPSSIAAEVTAGLSGGDVLLLHDADHYSATGCWANTAAAMPRVLDAIGQAGLGTTHI